MKDVHIKVAIVLIVAIVMFQRCRETYDTNYRYGFVDTNPTRRVSGFF